MRTQSPLHFFHQHLGQYLDPAVSPAGSAAPSLPTRTKAAREARAADSSATLPTRRVGTGMPVYYIVTPEHAWFLSNCELDDLPQSVTSVRIDDEEGKAAVKGNQYIAHWLYEQAPTRQPFMVGSIEKANPVPSFQLSAPPQAVTYCTTSSKTGRLTISLPLYRQAVGVVVASGIPWKDLRLANHLRDSLKRSAKGMLNTPSEASLRDRLQKLRQKYPVLPKVLGELGVKAHSNEDAMLHWYFTDGNYYGQPSR